MQVAVEVGIEPQARADGTIYLPARRSFPASHHPARTVRLDGRVDQGIAGETAPPLQITANAEVGAGDHQKIAWATAVQSGNQLRQEAGGKRLPACLDLDTRLRVRPPSTAAGSSIADDAADAPLFGGPGRPWTPIEDSSGL
jgi:hypothetical protein